RYGNHRNLHSFPTRRSSDLVNKNAKAKCKIDTFLLLLLDNYISTFQLRLYPGCDRGQSTIQSIDISTTALRHIRATATFTTQLRSEEHTSELQSRENLVCRL